MLIPMFPLPPDRLDDSRVIRNVEIVDRDIPGLASRDHQFAQTRFHLAPDQRVFLEDAQAAHQRRHGFARCMGIAFLHESSQIFHIQQGTRCKNQARHGLQLGRSGALGLFALQQGLDVAEHFVGVIDQAVLSDLQLGLFGGSHEFTPSFR